MANKHRNIQRERLDAEVAKVAEQKKGKETGAKTKHKGDIGRRSYSFEEREKMLAKTGHRCAHCGASLNAETMTVEHIYPVSRGGDNSEFNMTALCKGCNFNKGNAVYEPAYWYNYILKEYRGKYAAYFAMLRGIHAKQRDILEMSRSVYEIHPNMSFGMVMSAYGRNKKKAFELMHNISVKLKLERAFPADAEKIMKFLNKQKERYGASLNGYDNEYTILEQMRYGQVLVLANAMDEIFGVFIFSNADRFDTDFNQLNNFLDETGFSKEYIMTLAVANEKAGECMSDILADLLISFLSKKVVPIFYNINGYNKIHANPDYEFIEVPLNYRGMDGKLQFLSIKGARMYLSDYMEATKDVREMAEADAKKHREEINKVIEKTLSKDYVYFNGFFLSREEYDNLDENGLNNKTEERNRRTVKQQ